jgi:hypothetical protein
VKMVLSKISFKALLLSLACVLLLATSSVSLSPNKANAATKENQGLDFATLLEDTGVTQTDLTHLDKAVHTAITQSGTSFTVNMSTAIAAGLTSAQASSFRTAVMGPEFTAAEIQEMISIPNSITLYAGGGRSFTPTKYIKIVLLTFLAADIAHNLINDAYKVGMRAACHSFGENNAGVRGTCKFLGYW